MMNSGEKPLFGLVIDGIFKNNPVLVLFLGACPVLAVTTTAVNGLGIGLATMFVLICSNMVISLLRTIISDTIRLPAYLIITTMFVSVAQALIKAAAPDLIQSLGIFIPLITVNCIILSRAELFASKNMVLRSALDGIGMGLGFTLVCLLMGIIREALGGGSVFGFSIPWLSENPNMIFTSPAGAFFIYGMLIALFSFLMRRKGIHSTQDACVNCTPSNGCGMDEFRISTKAADPRE